MPLVLSGTVTVILVPLAIYYAHYWWDRRRWHTYERLIREWAHEEFFPGDMADEDWKALAVTKLSDAGFETTKLKELFEVSVWFAKGQASQELRGRIYTAREEGGYGQPENPK